MTQRIGSIGQRVMRVLQGRGQSARREAAQPRTYEAIALQLLHDDRSLTLPALIDRIAEEAMHDAQLAGGVATDIAVWGLWVYKAEAIAALQQMLGHTLVLEGEGPWLLVSPVVNPPLAFSRSAA